MSDTPSPPENPFDAEPFDNSAAIQEAMETPDETLSEGKPEVAAKAGKTLFIVAIVAGGIFFLMYSILFSGKKTVEVVPPAKIAVAPKSLEPPPLPVVEAPPVVSIDQGTAPDLPSLPAPNLPNGSVPALPDPINVPVLGNLISPPIDPAKESAAQAQAQARLRSNIMVKDGGGGGVGSLLGGTQTASDPNLDSNTKFALAAGSTNVETVAATRVKGDLRRTIVQGRIIQATMETALNTDLSAPIRAIVSRDTYGEAGNIPLIPKGSRLIGSYNTTLTSGQTRVLVIWTRMIRPDGVDVALGSPLVDGIGQAGVTGQIDTKFQEIFSRSLLSSAMNIAMAIGAEKITGGTTTTTSTTTGSQTSGDAATTATTNALNRLGAVTDGFIQRFLNVPPTILVDQGTPVNVFVNKDIVFPGDTATGARLVD